MKIWKKLLIFFALPCISLIESIANYLIDILNVKLSLCICIVDCNACRFNLFISDYCCEAHINSSLNDIALCIISQDEFIEYLMLHRNEDWIFWYVITNKVVIFLLIVFFYVRWMGCFFIFFFLCFRLWLEVCLSERKE